MVVEFFIEIIINKLKDFYKEWKRKREIKCIVRDFLRRSKDSEEWQEIDYEGVSEYLLSDSFFRDVKEYVWGDQDCQQSALDRIFLTVCQAAETGAGTDNRVIKKGIEDVLESILKHSGKWDDPNIYPYIRENIKLERQNNEGIQKILMSVEKMEKQAVQSIPASEQSPQSPVYYHVPKRTPHYVKTRSNIKFIEKMEKQGQILILGMQGIGKTEGVLWYLEEKKDLFDVVIWLNFASWDSAEETLSDYLGVTEEGRNICYDTDIISGLLDKLSSRTGKDTIIVFDNVNDEEMLILLSKQRFSCSVVITSCLSYAYDYFDEDIILYWNDLGKESSKELLSVLLRTMIPETEDEQLEELVQRCGGIPLVIRMAAAYIKARGISIADYLEMCGNKSALKFEKKKMQKLYPWGKNVNVYATYWLSYDAVCGDNAEADIRKLLHVMLFLSPYALSEDFLRNLVKLTKEKFSDSIYEILKYSLIREEGGVIVMKQVIQDIMRSFLTEHQKLEMVSDISRVLAEIFWELPPERSCLENYTESGIHTLYLLNIAEKEQLIFPYKEELLRGTGIYYYLKGFYARAQQYMQQAIELSEQSGKKLLYLRLCGELAEVYEAAGDDDMAEQFISQVRPEYNWLCSQVPLAAAQGLLIEAYLLENKERYDEAMERVEQMTELLNGCNLKGAESYLLDSYICKINILNELGRYQEASELLESAVHEMHSKGKNNTDPLMITLYGSGANALICLGEFDKALEYYQYQYACCKAIYRTEDKKFTHPSVVYICMNIASAYMKKGDFPQAESWLDQAEEIMVQTEFGHREVNMQMLFTRAIMKFKQGNYIDCYDTAVRILDNKQDASVQIRGYMWMALSEYGMKQWEKAKYHFEQADALEKETGMKIINAEEFLQCHETLVRQISEQARIEELINVNIP